MSQEEYHKMKPCCKGRLVHGYCLCDCHIPIDDLKQEIEIAKHNLWVAKTHVEDRQAELDKLEKQLAQRNENIGEDHG